MLIKIKFSFSHIIQNKYENYILWMKVSKYVKSLYIPFIFIIIYSIPNGQ